MYVSVITTKGSNGKRYESWLVRESFRTEDGPRHRTICNITKLPPFIREMIRDGLKGETLVPINGALLHDALDFGGLAVLRDAWLRLGLDSLFTNMPAVVAARLKAMVFARLLFPSSKLNLASQARGTALALACGLPADECFDENDLYAAMDHLVGRWSPLLKGLYTKTFPESVTIALYDITSIYFEGKGPEGLAHFGYSRDHRGDRKQVNLAVVTDAQGVPISLSVLRGNRADNKTLLGLLKILKRRFGITKATFVFDGGMCGAFNLAEMDAAGLNYVTRLSNATLESMINDTPTLQADMGQMELGDAPQLIEITHAGKRHVLAGGRWRANRDQERREARIKKGEAILAELAAKKRKKVNPQKLASTVGRALEKVKAHKYFSYEIDATGQIQWSRKTETIAEEEQRDGWYLLSTNETAEASSKEEVLSRYKNLLEVEDAFRELKTYLEVRPIYHYRPDRVVNHIRICYLAYWLSARLGREWQMAGEHQEVVRLLRELQTIRIGYLSFGAEHRALLTDIPEDLEETLKKLKQEKLFSTPPNWVKLPV